ncbi:unnamed protein product [Choristocarpus tenellus]
MEKCMSENTALHDLCPLDPTVPLRRPERVRLLQCAKARHSVHCRRAKTPQRRRGDQHTPARGASVLAAEDASSGHQRTHCAPPV